MAEELLHKQVIWEKRDDPYELAYVVNGLYRTEVPGGHIYRTDIWRWDLRDHYISSGGSSPGYWEPKLLGSTMTFVPNSVTVD